MRKKTGSIQKRGDSYRIAYYDANHIRHYETWASEEDAHRELAKRLYEAAQGIPVSAKPNSVTFAELAADVVNDYKVNARRSVSDIEARFRVNILPVFGPRKAAHITTAQIKAYIVNRRDGGATAGTVNRELEAIRRAFNLASAGRKILTKPYIPMLKEDNVRTGFFTREEVDRLAAALKAPLGDFVLFGFLTGWRYSEIQNLRWSNVDFAAGEIRLDSGATKNGDGRVFPLTVELRTLLEAQRTKKMALRNTANVVGSMMATSLALHVFMISAKPVGQFRKQWKAACNTAGIPCVVDAKGRVLKALRTFHDLRRSFARDLDRKGIRRGAIMKLGGWKTDSVFQRYNIVSDADLRDAVEILDSTHSASGDPKGQKRR